MSVSYAFPLLAEKFSGGTQGLKFVDGGGLGLNYPPNAVDFGDFGDEVTFIMSLSGVANSPTTWKVGAKFQILVPHTVNFIHQNRRWVDLTSQNLTAMVAEGVGFGTVAHPSPTDGAFGYIADQTDSLTNPITVVRTIRHFGKGVRLALDLPCTGGTDPRANLSINAIVRSV